MRTTLPISYTCVAGGEVLLTDYLKNEGVSLDGDAIVSCGTLPVTLSMPLIVGIVALGAKNKNIRLFYPNGREIKCNPGVKNDIRLLFPGHSEEEIDTTISRFDWGAYKLVLKVKNKLFQCETA